MEPGWKSPSSAICRGRVDLSSTKGGNGSGMGPPRLKVLHTLRFRPQKMKLRDPSLSCRALAETCPLDKWPLICRDLPARQMAPDLLTLLPSPWYNCPNIPSIPSRHVIPPALHPRSKP